VNCPQLRFGNAIGTAEVERRRFAGVGVAFASMEALKYCVDFLLRQLSANVVALQMTIGRFRENFSA
jgi:hypothetical protein